MLTSVLMQICFGCYPDPFGGSGGNSDVCDVNRPQIEIESRRIVSRSNVELKLNLGDCLRNLRVTGPSGVTEHTLVSGLLTINEDPQLIYTEQADWIVEEININNPVSLTFEIERLQILALAEEIMRGHILFNENGIAGTIGIPMNTSLNEQYDKIELSWNNAAGSGSLRKLAVGQSAYSVLMAITPALPNEFHSWTATHRYYNSVRGSHLSEGMTQIPDGFSSTTSATLLAVSEVNFAYNQGEEATAFARTQTMNLADGGGAVPVFAWINREIDASISY